MWKNKKLTLIALLVVLILVGTTAAAVFANKGDGNSGPSRIALAQIGSGDQVSSKTLLARVAEILGIDQQRLKDAFAQAQREMRDEALEKYLNKLVDQGKITRDQADQYKKWWQARPDVPSPRPFQHFGYHRFPGGR